MIKTFSIAFTAGELEKMLKNVKAGGTAEVAFEVTINEEIVLR